MARGQIEFGDSSPEVEEYVDKALAAFGLYAEGGLVLEQDEYWLWPENEEPFAFWLAIQTQWNVGMAGATGLNYPGVETCLRMHGFKPRDRQRLFLQVQMMERACLEEWARQRKS